MGPGEVPTPEQLHGKAWLRGDPHSKYRFMRSGTLWRRAMGRGVAQGGRGAGPPPPRLATPTVHKFVAVPDKLLQHSLHAGC